MQALRAQISETEASLLVAGRRCRALRHLRHSIRARTLTPLPQPQARTTSTRPGHAFPPTKYQYNQLPDMQPHTHGDCNDSGLDAHVCPHERKCPSATSSLNQMVPLWRRRRREAVFMERQEENLKPICDFKMCASACFRLHGCCLWRSVDSFLQSILLLLFLISNDGASFLCLCTLLHSWGLETIHVYCN